MEVNNFETIKSLLNPATEDDFYFLQLLQRKKEHPELGSNNRVIKSYYIKNSDHLSELESEIKAICVATGARAYINLNKRSFKRIALHTMKGLCDNILNDEYVHASRCYNTACGKYSNDKDKTFIIDLDYDKGSMDVSQIARHYRCTMNLVERINTECEPIGNKFVAMIPTKNGEHLIMRAFNLQKFKEFAPDIDVHKNNPTVLYIPDNV